MKLPHVNKEPLARTPIFVQTPFSHSTLKLKQKNSRRKPLVFSLHFLFQRDENHHSNLTSKIMKMCEQILKKDSAQYNSISLNCEKIKSAIIAAWNCWRGY